LAHRWRWSQPYAPRYPCNRPLRPIGLWDVEAPTFSRKSAHRWRCSCQPYTWATSLSPGRSLLHISVRGWVDHKTIVLLKKLGQLRNPMSLLGIEPATFRLLAFFLNQLRYRVPHWTVGWWPNLRYFSHIGIFLEGLRKTTKTASHDSLCPDEVSNRRLPE
jgi:hypothetical protein